MLIDPIVLGARLLTAEEVAELRLITSLWFEANKEQFIEWYNSFAQGKK